MRYAISRVSRVSRSPGPWPAVALLLVVQGGLFGGCFVGTTDAEATRLTFSVGPLGDSAAASRQQAREAGYWDPLGLFHLYRFPKYVRVAVEHPDGYELASGTWPDPVEGVGGSEEGAAGEVEVSMDVPSGNGRRLRVLGFVHDLDRVRVYGEDDEYALDLVPGQNLDLEVGTALLEVGRVELTVRCKDGTVGVLAPHRIHLVDKTPHP